MEIHQRDGEVITVPIWERVPAPGTPGIPYNADPTTHTASMVIKRSRWAEDTTPVPGSISDPDVAGVRWATYAVPDADSATYGRKWLHAWVTPAGGDPKTIAAEHLDVVPT